MLLKSSSGKFFLFCCIIFISVISTLSSHDRGEHHKYHKYQEERHFMKNAINMEGLKLLNQRLSDGEKDILEGKGTEPPFSGVYWDSKAEGSYFCRRCHSPLYRSCDKFDSSCGWPSFDDEIAGAVSRQTDSDGRRTEILCTRCGGHLGHVFQGEGFTPKNTRHCVNSLSMRFVPSRGETGRALFAGGCFWGLESLLQKQKGVIETCVGYTGGHSNYPSYQDVCTHESGHVEAVEVLYDPSVVSYRELAMLFFEIHDPCQTDGQGPDRGSQYLSKIFYENESQKETGEELIALLRARGYEAATVLEPASAFWPGENYHQDYYKKNGKTPYCHAYTKRF